MKNLTLLFSLFFCFNVVSFAQDKENLPLVDTQWTLTNVNDKVINKNEEGLESFIVFAADNSFKGFAGCNKFQGNYKIENGKLSLEKIGSTKMECENSNNEDEFLKTLHKAIQFKIVQHQLMLKDKNKTIAVFESK
jgi:heat shock protein HslJ